MTDQRRAALAVAMTIGEAIRDLKQVPSGELYAQVMGHLSYSQYEGILSALISAGLVKRENHLLTWVG